ncbi:(2Fe-2S)-binding protein [Acidocella sp.]|uniref:(2Fe-2S)-binding protein n=1 Tax=Acidocella sp. TaxID=50710 RepID=UPI003D0107B5
MDEAPTIGLWVNGAWHEVAVPPGTALLHVLRNDLRLNGPKYGCGFGECGACTVLIGGRAARACCTPVSQVGALPVVTLEGLVKDGVLDEVQHAFVQEQAAQCGYCLNGMIMTVRALLDAGGARTLDEIKRALRFNLCRCGAHVEILRAACRVCGVVLEEGMP